MLVNWRRWPMPRAPTSSTRNPASRSAREIVSGVPISPLWFPTVATVDPAVESTWAIRSFVVVLPLLPVTLTNSVLVRRAAR